MKTFLLRSLAISSSALLLFAFTYVGIVKEPIAQALFKIARSKDVNEIFYAARVTDKHQLDVSNPVDVYWIKYSNGNIRESLTWIQRKYAYGLKFLSAKESEVVFQFVSYNKRDFTLKKDLTGVFKVFTTSQGKEVQVERIFIQIDGGTFWLPKISRVELHAKDAKTGNSLLETINP